MSEQETIADIIAEMQNTKYGDEECQVKWCLTTWADRLEAAWKRMEWTHKKELETRDAVIQTEVAGREAEREAHKREIDKIKKQVADLQQQLPEPDLNWRDICAKCFENGATEQEGGAK